MSKCKKKKRKQKKAPSAIVLEMFLHCKGGPMKDRRAERGGSKDDQEMYKNDGWE